MQEHAQLCEAMHAGTLASTELLKQNKSDIK